MGQITTKDQIKTKLNHYIIIYEHANFKNRLIGLENVLHNMVTPYVFRYISKAITDYAEIPTTFFREQVSLRINVPWVWNDTSG